MPKYFSWSEFDSTDPQNPHQKLRGSGEANMCRDFVEKLDKARELAGVPFVISSGFRTPEWNAIVSSTGEEGPHTTGKAADIKCSGAQANKILSALVQVGFSGYGISQKGVHKSRFVHVDDCTPEETNGLRPWVWSY